MSHYADSESQGQTVISTVDARQGETRRGLRRILIISLSVAIIGLAIAWVIAV